MKNDVTKMILKALNIQMMRTILLQPFYTLHCDTTSEKLLPRRWKRQAYSAMVPKTIRWDLKMFHRFCNFNMWSSHKRTRETCFLTRKHICYNAYHYLLKGFTTWQTKPKRPIAPPPFWYRKARGGQFLHCVRDLVAAAGGAMEIDLG